MTQYTLPPEWFPQSSVLISWPHEGSDWWDIVRPALNKTYVNIVQALTASGTQSAMIICYDAAHQKTVTNQLMAANINLAHCQFFIIPTDDVWTRDYGPLILTQKNDPFFCEGRLLNFQFNGWGAKYDANLDNQVTNQLLAQQAFSSVPTESYPFVLEGGSIETDGQGSLLTTTRCLMSPMRNPQYNAAAITDLLKSTLGIEQVLWLEAGEISGDDTDSHIDILARFTDPHTIAYVRCDDRRAIHYEALCAMESQLQSLRNRAGQPYRLVPLPLPKSIEDDQGRQLPATYANFLIINGAVLMPTYQDDQDEVAKNRLQGCFPDRPIIGISCRPVIYNYGSLHCITMQIPKIRPMSTHTPRVRLKLRLS